MHRTRNAAYGQPYRGFESLPLRQWIRLRLCYLYAFRLYLRAGPNCGPNSSFPPPGTCRHVFALGNRPRTRQSAADQGDDTRRVLQSRLRACMRALAQHANLRRGTADRVDNCRPASSRAAYAHPGRARPVPTV